jgi:hypothetical protein
MVRSSHKKGEMEKSIETAQFRLETGHMTC